jgi:uncharacterized protein (DUF362 family)
MPDSSKSLVVKISSNLVIDDDDKIDLDILHQMMEAGLEALAAPIEHIRFLQDKLGVGNTIGLKVNTIGGPKMSTRPDVVRALSRILNEAGISPKNQIIWDRFDSELSEVGYKINSRGVGPYCFGTDHPGVGYSSELVSNGKVGGLLSRILTDYCQSIINVPVLKDHGVAGITGALKNQYGSIHNPNKYHGTGCNPYIADLNSLEQIKSKQRLIIMDALKVQFQGGPAYQKRWSANCGMLLFGLDPVAIDTIGYGIIENLREKAGLEKIKGSKREPVYLKTAAYNGLGKNEISQIELKALIM